MFGELLGAWLAERWLAMGRPRPVRLVELGPGRGTLMADALRATRGVAGFHAAIDLHLVEINDRLRTLLPIQLGIITALPLRPLGFTILPFRSLIVQAIKIVL